MADDKSKKDNRDRGKVAGRQNYEVEHFAAKHNISLEKARGLIDRFGNDRDRLDQEASKQA